MHETLSSLHGALLSSIMDISPLKSKESEILYFHCKEATTIPFKRQVTTVKLSFQSFQFPWKMLNILHLIELFFFIF